MRKSTLLSVVVPCYNEEEVIEETHSRLISACRKLNVAFEIIYVNDGSKDNSLCILRKIVEKDGEANALDLSRNFGHQMAVSAGIEYSRGDAILIIDADLQDPPELAGSMIALWEKGFDVVYGKRKKREGESAFKLITAKVFYKIINFLSDTEIPLDTGDFRLIDRKVADALKKMPERDRFLRGMVPWTGFKQTPIEYDRAERFAGSTKYHLKSMLRLATDGILSFTVKPLRISVWIGLGISLLSLIAVFYLILNRILTSNWVPGWTLLAIMILFLGGVQLFSIGVLGEYIGRIYRESKRRPLYLVSEYINKAISKE